MKKNFYFVFLSALIIALSSCTKDKKNSGSAVVVTPTPVNTCANYAYRQGFYYDTNNHVVACSPGDANSCVNFRFEPTLGVYLDSAGNRVNCNFNNLFNQNGLLPYHTTQGNGCEAYASQGIFYPVLMGSTMVCVNRDTLAASFTPNYLNQLYYNQPWTPGRPLLASCRTGIGNCQCNGTFWGTLSWCWARF